MKKVFWLLGLVILLVLVWRYQIRRVGSVDCSSCEDDLLREVVTFRGQTVKVATQQIRLAIRSHTDIGWYQIKEQGLGHLQIDVKKKEPRFSLKRGANYFNFDWDGRFVNQSMQTNLPFIETAKIDGPSALNALRIIYFLSKLENNLKAKIENEYLLVETPNLMVKFPTKGDYKLLISKYYYIRDNMMGEITKNLVVNQETVVTIDLRFERPIALVN